MNNGKLRYKTANSTSSQTTEPAYKPEQAVVGTGTFKRAATAIEKRKKAMADRMKKLGY